MKDDEDKHAPAQVEGLATARPWRAKTYEGKAAVFGPVHPVDGGDYAPLAILHYSDPSKANAELIVTAVNAYDSTAAKVEKLEAALRDIRGVGHVASPYDRSAYAAALQRANDKLEQVMEWAAAALVESPTEESA